MPRPQFTVRWMMVAVAVVALSMYVRRVRRASPRPGGRLRDRRPRGSAHGGDLSAGVRYRDALDGDARNPRPHPGRNRSPSPPSNLLDGPETKMCTPPLTPGSPSEAIRPHRQRRKR